jgi:hypothetical protein
MTAAMRFFETRREWRDWEPVASLAVVSTFAGDDKLLSEEFLNLAPRRHLAYRVLTVQDVAQASFEKQKAVIYLETTPPEPDVRAKLLEFAQAGGLLIVPQGTVDAPPEERRAEHSLRRMGKGRVAMPLQKWEDPFTLVDQIHVLVSHREDPVQLWNDSDMDALYLANPAEDRAVVHLVPYASGPSLPITLGLRKTYRRARVLTLSSEMAVRPARGPLGFEIPVREFTDYAVVELEA